MRLRQKKKLSFKGHAYFYGYRSLEGQPVSRRKAIKDIKEYYKICTEMGMSQRLFIKQGLAVYNNWKDYHNFNGK